MSHNLSDYFALEAGEYLEQLDALLTQPGEPDLPRFLRLARGVRGSARVAREEEVAAVAERLEGAARALQAGSVAWSEELRARAIRTVDDLKVLVRARGRWGEAEERRAAEAVARWEGVGVEPRPAAAPGAAGDRLLPFVRREVEGVVAELERAVEELRRAPAEREPLRALVQRMRPLRGVTGIASLAAIQEVLEGVEDAANRLLSRPEALTDAHLALLSEARGALPGALGALERGAPGEAELVGFRDARERLAKGAEAEEDETVVPIGALFHDEGPHVVSSPLAPAQEGEAAPEEVERFLRLEATGFLDRAEALVAGLPPRPEGGFGRVAARLARLARAVEELASTYGISAAAGAAARAAQELRASADLAEARAALARLRAALPGAVEAPEPAAEPPAPEAAEEEGVVPVEAILLRGEAALREALALRPEVERLAADGAAGPELRARVAELFDLVSLGLEPARA